MMVWMVGNGGEVPALYRKPAAILLRPNWLLSHSFPSRSPSHVAFCGAVFSWVVFRGASGLELSRTQSGTPPSNVIGSRSPKHSLERCRAAFSAVATIKPLILQLLGCRGASSFTMITRPDSLRGLFRRALPCLHVSEGVPHHM